MNDRKLHFIAIGGAGMSGLALVCHQLGAQVSGSDQTESSYTERLRAAGLAPVIGHDAANVPADADIVVSTAIPESNPELLVGAERGQRRLHRSELLAELCAMKRLIAVAGAHGKTSTAGMLVAMLRAGGAEPAFLLGGELPGAGADGGPANAGWGAGDWIVAEADESDGSFLRLEPEVAVVTNVELDHHSHWGGERELWGAFEEFARRARGLVIPAESRYDRLAAAGQELRRFDPAGPAPVPLAVPGAHNAANARAALAACELAAELGLDVGADGLRRGLGEFPGMVRRLERKGSHRGAAIYDDYAHHPTEVAASLTAIRDDLRPQRLIAVFQPHLYSRTKALARRFGEALVIADEVGVLDVYAARERPEGELEGVSGRDVALAAAEFGRGKPVLWLETLEIAERVLVPRLGPGDLLVTVGAGDVFRLADRLVEAG